MANWDEGLAVRCASCRRAVAWGDRPAKVRSAVYCSDWCRLESPATTMEARNDLWQMAHMHSNIAPAEIARRSGVAHSLVYRTLRRLKDTA